jgi:2-polyprenyl-3-methyl-5-hydroxy-6-metoxy-1,4-benzoquinol methylase
MGILNLLKKLPLDFGQGHLRKTTKGKLIAPDLVKRGKGKSALDVGCREGIQSEWLKKKSYKVTSIDIDKSYRYCRIVDVNKKLPFKDSSFDLIWCSEVIEHLDNPKKTISEFIRVLKKNGRIILTTPNSYALIFRLLYLFGLSPKKLQRKDHKHFFDIKDIRDLLPSAEIYGFFPYMVIKRKIKNFAGLLSPTFVVYYKK